MSDDLLTVPGGSHPSNQPGATHFVDVIAETRARTIEQDVGTSTFRVVVDVVHITRYVVLITDVRAVLPLWELAQRGIDPANAIPDRLGFRAVDTHGGEWSRDWDGWNNDRPRAWIHSGGRCGSDVDTLDALLRSALKGVAYFLTAVS